MNALTDALVFGVRSSKEMVDAMTADLKGGDWEHRPVQSANCAAWLIGHLVLTDRRAMRMAGATDLPELPAGFKARFGREDGAPQAVSFGDPSILVPLFDKHRELVMNTIANFPESKLNEPLPNPHPRFKTFRELFQGMAFHVMLHAGQLSTIRRSLGRPPLF